MCLIIKKITPCIYIHFVFRYLDLLREIVSLYFEKSDNLKLQTSKTRIIENKFKHISLLKLIKIFIFLHTYDALKTINTLSCSDFINLFI